MQVWSQRAENEKVFFVAYNFFNCNDALEVELTAIMEGLSMGMARTQSRVASV